MLIMIVEDDEILAGAIKTFLEKWGYKAVIAKNYHDIIADYHIYHPHLILMDINLPLYDGFHWCSKIRNISNVPLIYISSRNDDRDKIMGIAQGGDDYVEKPFHLDLLKAKIEAILRRTYQYKVKSKVVLKDNLYFDIESASLIYNNQDISFTKSERKIMKMLMENRTHIVSREELMEEIWNTDEYISDGTLTTLISRLRSKLKDECGENIIKTKKGQGYYIQ